MIHDSGSISITLDELALGVTGAAPGVNYPFRYRDPAGGPAGTNLSDALRVQHLP